MAFGQASGPPATGKQIRELLELLEAAGHSDFRDARGPMGFSQRQAGGKFTRDEAEAFIEQLEAEVNGDDPRGASSAPPKAGTVRPKQAKPPSNEPRSGSSWRDNTPRRTEQHQIDLSEVPVEHLAAELQRRGWIVAEP